MNAKDGRIEFTTIKSESGLSGAWLSSDGRTIVIETRDPETGRTSIEYRAPGDPGHAYFMEKMHLNPAALPSGEASAEIITIQSRHLTLNAYLPPALDCYPGSIEQARKASLFQTQWGDDAPVEAWALPDGPTRYFHNGLEYVLETWDTLTGAFTLRRGESRSYFGAENTAGLLQMTYTDGRPVYVKAYNPGLASPIVTERAEDALPGIALPVLQKQFPDFEFFTTGK